MARKPKRSETLSIRIKPNLKEQLAIAANYMECSIASVVEQAVARGMDQAKVPFEDVGSQLLRSAFEGGTGVPLSHIYNYAEHSIPLVMQLRLFFLMPKGLSVKERLICEAIVTQPEFSGDDPIFEDDSSLKTGAPSVDVTKAMREMALLESYADYRVHEMQRPDGLKIGFSEYVRLKTARET